VPFFASVNQPSVLLYQSDNCQLSIRLHGMGERLILFFPGFGILASELDFMAEFVPPGHRIAVVDHFFHGESVLRIPDQFMKADDWKEEFVGLLRFLGVEKAHLAGYSMGGRISLFTEEILPTAVSGITLLAPDGIKRSPWYWFASRTKFGMAVFDVIHRNPRPFYLFLAFFRKLRLVSPKIAAFVGAQMATRENRQLIRDTWWAYRDFLPNLDRVGENVSDSMPVTAIFGKYDSVIPAKLGHRLQRFVKAKVATVETGHNLLKPSVFQELVERGLWVFPE
jgi:pimeloyl-ACP methyl ester carboxylesterase